MFPRRDPRPIILEASSHHNLVATILKVLREMSSFMGEWTKESRRISSCKEFKKIDPPSFEGKHDPSAIEMWIKEVKKIFGTLGISIEYRVTLLPLCLKKSLRISGILLGIPMTLST